MVISLVGQDRKEGLLVRNLAAERIRHTDCLRRVSVDQCTALVRPRNDIVDEDSPIHEVDTLTVRRERATVETEIARVRDDGGHTCRRKCITEQFELAPGRHLAPVDDGNPWRPLESAPLAVALKKRGEQFCNRSVVTDVEMLLEPGHQRLAV